MKTRREQQVFYNSRPWRNLSLACRARAGWLCENCKPRTVAAVLAHHVKPIAEGGEPLEISNTRALCFQCHEAEHNRAPNEQQRAWSIYLRELKNTI